MEGRTIIVIGNNHHTPRDIFLSLTRLDVVLTVIPENEFRLLNPGIDSAFQSEPLCIEIPNQITHGPQKKGRGGKVRRW